MDTNDMRMGKLMGGGGNNTNFWGRVAWAVIGRRLAVLAAIVGIAAGLYWMWA